MPKPIMALAPMADITDSAFRFIIAKYSKWGGCDIGDGSKENLPAAAFRTGGPDVMFTEFVSADGLCHPAGRRKLLIDLSYTEAERPIVAQLFTGNPEKMREAAALVRELGFDGLDINMGCPDRSIEKSGAGAALMKNPKLARAIIRAAREGVGGEGGIPVSVKTRLGYNKDELEEWLTDLLSEEPAAVTIHARTRQEMSAVPARWGEIARAVALRDRAGSRTLIFGNGDVYNLADARTKAAETGCDGVMLGRAIFGNPFLFSHSCEFRNGEVIFKKLSAMVEHTELFEKIFSGVKSFAVMKKHYKAYAEGFPGARELRVKLMAADGAAEVEKIVEGFLSRGGGSPQPRPCREMKKE